MSFQILRRRSPGRVRLCDARVLRAALGCVSGRTFCRSVANEFEIQKKFGTAENLPIDTPTLARIGATTVDGAVARGSTRRRDGRR